MRNRKPVERACTRDCYASWIAILAMLLQVFFATVHTTAIAIAASGALNSESSSGVPFGIFQICTAEGIQQVGGKANGTGGQNDSTVSSSCPICNSASVSPAIPADAVDCLSVDGLSMVMSVPTTSDQHATLLRHANPIRGPPIFNII